MPSIGGEMLYEKYGSPLAIAEALLLGKLESSEQEFVKEFVDDIILEAARIRLESAGKLKRKPEQTHRHGFRADI